MAPAGGDRFVAKERDSRCMAVAHPAVHTNHSHCLSAIEALVKTAGLDKSPAT